MLQIYRFLLQGRIDEVRRMLSVHANSGTDMYQSMDEILRKMPLYSIVSILSEDIYRPQTKLRDGNVFIRVCLSTGQRGPHVIITHDALDPPQYWHLAAWPLKHLWLASGWYTSYWNAFLFTTAIVAIPYVGPGHLFCLVLTQTQICIITVRISSCGKVMFSLVSVCTQGVRCTTQAGRQPSPPPSEIPTAADGTHPTGMHSCITTFFSHSCSSRTFKTSSFGFIAIHILFSDDKDQEQECIPVRCVPPTWPYPSIHWTGGMGGVYPTMHWAGGWGCLPRGGCGRH